MTFTESFKTCSDKYFVFKGRASRSEYWWFFLAVWLIDIVLGVVSEHISYLFSLATFIPCISSAVRRLHDTNHSGWWLIVPIYDIVLLVTKGNPGNNKYGPAPVE